MINLKGQGVSDGVVMGPLYFFTRREEKPIPKEGAGKERERLLFQKARQAAVRQMNELAGKCRSEANEEAAVLFETHAMMAEDEDFIGAVCGLIDAEACSAGYAVRTAGARFAGMLNDMEDEYLRARAADVRDVTERILDQLRGSVAGGIRPEGPVILAADDLAPSETARLDPRMILGFVTRGGSANSHTAILARSMGIPAVCGLGDALKEEYAGRIVCMDGGEGDIFIEPDERTLAVFHEKKILLKENERALSELRGQEDVTPDGQRMMLYCNIASVQDIPAVIQNDGQGIGLFRSEFLYLSENDYPTEERQFEIYRQAAEEMGGKRVVIRTLDVGADKQAGYFHIKKEENPALGLRGVRLCLNRPEIFMTQLRALYRASAYGKIAIMFPMITSVWEVRECRRACRKAMEELKEEGIPYRSETEIGVMIETPASALIADELAREVDFFSVGTNDLTQYMLACDRQQSGIDRFFDPRHPAVLRAVRMAAEAAHKNRIWIGVCGELASDSGMLPFFLEMGIDELSVSPSMVLPMRREIRNFRIPKNMPFKGDERSE